MRTGMSGMAGLALAGLAAVALAAPLTGQETVTVAVSEAGSPAAGVDVFAMVNQGKVRTGTTSSAGETDVDSREVAIAAGTEVRMYVRRCDGEAEVVLVPSGERYAECEGEAVEAGCQCAALGMVAWPGSGQVRLDLARRTARAVPSPERPLTAPTDMAHSGLRATLTLGPTFYGGDMSSWNTAIGGELVVGQDFDNGFGIGGGLSYYSFGLDFAPDLDGTQIGLFVEPRYSFHLVDSPFQPYAALRAGYLRYRFSFEGDSNSDNAWGIGPAAGIAVPLNSRLSFDAGARLIFVNFTGEFGGSGTELGLAAGIRWSSATVCRDR